MSAMVFVKQSTKFEMYCTKFMWTLQNCTFFMGLQNSKIFKSENFRLKKTNQLCYVTFNVFDKFLELHMDGYYLPLYLIITLNCVRKDGTPIKSQTFTKHVNSIDKKVSSMKLYDKLQRYMDDDTLNFLITIEDIREANSLEVVDDPSTTCQVYKNKAISRNIDTMYTNQELCDVTLLLGQKEKFYAHSVILAALSPHFLSMFSKDRLENKSHHVVDMSEDVDVTPQILRGFLDFAYGIKSMMELKDMVLKLTIMAIKYDIEEMRMACEYLMCDTLDKDNVIALLMFAVKYELATLKKKALLFAKLHIDVVKESMQFEELYGNKELVLELL